MGRFETTAFLSSVAWLAACQFSDRTLRIYTSVDPAVAQELRERYMAETGKDFEYVRLSAGEALERIREEKSRPRASAWVGGPSVGFAAGAREKLFEPYQPKLTFELSPEYRNKEWRWTGLYLSAIGFATNTEFLKKHRLEPPASWDDLLKPSFKGQVSYALPYTSGTALIFLLGVVRSLGEEPAFDFFSKLHPQVRQYTRSGAACIPQAATGEAAVCIAFSQDILAQGIEKGLPLTMSFPKEGLAYEVAAAAIMKNAPQPEPAQRLMDWLHTPSAQSVFHHWHKTPIDPQVGAKPLAGRGSKLKLIEIDTDWAVLNQARLIERWRKITGN